MITFLVTININHVLKMLHHESRPYFDDPTLLDSGLVDCAGEYGNPSAHAHCAAFFTYSLYHFYKEKHLISFNKCNKVFRVLLDLLPGILAFGIGISRLYAGRHTLD